MSRQTIVRPGRRLLVHCAVQVALLLLFFLPGGLIWNRIEPLVLGLPCGVFATVVLLPAIIVANMALYVAGHWAEDRRIGDTPDSNDRPRLEDGGS